MLTSAGTLFLLANVTPPLVENPLNGNWSESDCAPIFEPASGGQPPYLRSRPCWWGQWVQREYLGADLPLEEAKIIRFKAELFFCSCWRTRGPIALFEYADWQYRFDMYQGRALATSSSPASSETADFILSSGVAADEYYTFEVYIDLAHNTVSGSIEQQSKGDKSYWWNNTLSHDFGSSAHLDGRVHFRLDSLSSSGGHLARGVELEVFTDDGSDASGEGLPSACTHSHYLFVLPANLSGDYAIEGSEGIEACMLQGEAPTRFFNFSHGECNTRTEEKGDYIVDSVRAVFQLPPGTPYFQGEGHTPHELQCWRRRIISQNLTVAPAFTTASRPPITYTVTPASDGVTFELRAGAECQRILATGEPFPADEDVMCFMARSTRPGEQLGFLDCAAIPEQEDQYTTQILTNACSAEPFKECNTLRITRHSLSDHSGWQVLTPTA